MISKFEKFLKEHNISDEVPAGYENADCSGPLEELYDIQQKKIDELRDLLQDVEETKKISLNEGDVLAVRLPDECMAEDVFKIKVALNKAFKDNKVMVYVGRIEFTTIGKDETND